MVGVEEVGSIIYISLKKDYYTTICVRAHTHTLKVRQGRRRRAVMAGSWKFRDLEKGDVRCW